MSARGGSSAGSAGSSGPDALVPRGDPFKFTWGPGGDKDLPKKIGEVADTALKFLSDRMPELEIWLLEGLDTIFAPRLILRQLVVAMVLQTGIVSYNALVVLSQRLLSRLNQKHHDIKHCFQCMKQARDYEEWKRWAERLDELEGHDVWRKRPDSLLYDHQVLQNQIDELNAMMHSEDVFGLMFKLRGSLSRNQHGMLHEGLFSRAHAGTKLLVERYHETACEALHYICEKDATAQDIPTDAKLAFFNETRHAYGRTALMLSGGAAMGFYHVGVVKALLERKLLPRVISGASAGSIVAAMVGTRTDAELMPMFHGEDIILDFFQPKRTTMRQNKSKANTDKYKAEAFWQFLMPPALRWMGDCFWSLASSSENLLKMDTDYFRSVLRHNVGSCTFQEAFDRSGRIVNITVAPRNRTDPPRLLNYLTAPHVLVWSATVCSSSVPGVFEPSTLLVKEADGSIRPEYSSADKFVDGSMEADLPMQQISELFNINHFLVSQVNPHATLLSSLGLNKSVWSHPLYSFLVGLVGFLKAQVRNWFRSVIEFISLRRMAPVWATRRGGIQLLTQEYEGKHSDVTITPWEGTETVLSSFMKMLSNPTKQDYCDMVKVSEHNTWPKTEMIRCHCAVEMALEHCVQSMRKRLTIENQVRMAAASGALASSRHSGLRGRVPSFYTSRSIVNLSGLNVTDPSVVMAKRPSFGSRVSLGGDSQMSEGEHNDVGLSMEVPLQYSVPLWDHERPRGSDSMNALHLPFGMRQHVSSEMLRNDHLSPPPSGSMGNGVVAPDDVAPLGDIVKSTSMANFYYRRSKSWDAIHKDHSHGDFSTYSDVDAAAQGPEQSWPPRQGDPPSPPTGSPQRSTPRSTPTWRSGAQPWGPRHNGA